MNGFFTGIPPARDWFYGIRTFAASMLALYIAMLMQMPRPYWAMATVYIVSSPFLGPTSSKALYRAIGTFLGAAAAVQGVAFGIWALDVGHVVCDPTSLLQGHAAWHLLGAGAAWCLWRYFTGPRIAQQPAAR